MKDKKRLTIGLMLHYLDNDYSKTLLRGAVPAAQELDVNLVIMPGRSLNCQLHDIKYTAFEYQYNAVYSFASDKNLDALVISAGTVGQFVTREEFKQFVDSYEGLPVLTMECAVRGYPCIRLSGSGMKSIVEHLIKEHGRKYIAFVSGPKENADAEERLSFYREALMENGIEFDPDMVVYGKFSEFCVDLVGDLLDRHPEIDAICFANDMMCKGGYKAIEQRGLVVGKDIMVTGYDDSSVAKSLSPMLTTVRADAAMLGAQAVRTAVRLAKGETVDDSISLGSTVILRESCGCTSFWDESISGREDIVTQSDSAQLAEMVVSEYMPDSQRSSLPVIKELKTIMTLLFDYARSPEEGDPSDQIPIFNDLLSKGLLRHFSPQAFADMLKSVRYMGVTLCGEDLEKAIAIHRVIEHGFDALTSNLLRFHTEMVEDLNFTHFLINNIAKDMTANDNDEEKCYYSIVNNLYRTHILSSYIYTYSAPVIHTQHMEWCRPNTLYLKSYHDGDQLAALKPEYQRMSCFDCITNDYTPDRCRTLILFPLFMNEEHYGIISVEMEQEYFSHIYSIAPQICTAIKLTRLVKQLESSLDAATSRNSQLNRISMYDELTGVFNRRGFYEHANKVLTAPENIGKHAVLIFADLDNLKKINDSFGHEEGDYAITTAAGLLKSSLRASDVVARIGGDEFAAFALCDESAASVLAKRVKQLAAAHNVNSTKRYNISMSVGICALKCAATLSIQAFMDKADAALYEDKKHKETDIMKK